MAAAVSANSDRGNDQFSAPKRRKIRKGTQSCWECKRRKIRCTFAAPTEPVCDGCRSRRVECLSQEYHDDKTLTSAPDEQESRLDKTRSQAGSSVGIKSPPICNYMDSAACINSPDDYDGISQQLLAAWPSQHELEIILNTTISNTFTLFHGITCMPYSNFISKNLPSLQDMLQPPLLGSHPVFIARRLLMLGLFLQGGSLLSSEKQIIMFRAVKAANRLVTSNDDLTNSLEGIECIMMESMFRNNTGNLRGAWLSNRRAMAIAQLMNLNQYRAIVPANSNKDGNARSRPKAIDAETRNRIEPQSMWFRLVATDRYLSLVLGLPQESQQDPHSVFLESNDSEDYTLIDRLERLEVVAAGLILQRNSTNIHNLEVTLRVDKILQEAAALMPAQWWLPPEPLSITGNTMEAFKETLRLMNQLTHYHLLAQLHLPYILLTSNDRKYDYSKMTAIHASREILLRFVLYYGSEYHGPSYCRGVDFLTFIASMTLCLAHIKGHWERQASITANESISVFQCLVHQRPQDIGFIERILKSMEHKATRDDNAITQTITGSLKHLVAIEASAANQSSCTASLSCQIGIDELQSDGISMHMNNGVLQIYIPYYGTIKIELDNSSRRFLEVDQLSVNSVLQKPSETLQSATERSLIMEPINESSGSNGRNTEEGNILIANTGEDFSNWAFNNIDLNLFETL